ncbi:MAG: glycoside hydrolase family 18 protein [Rhodanobacter sp.]
MPELPRDSNPPVTIRRHGLLALLAIALAGCAMPSMSQHQYTRYRVVGYDTARQAIPAASVDHIDTLIFAFANLVDGRVVLDVDGDGRLHRLTQLKTAHSHLKVVVSVGGWGVDGFSAAASTAAGRQRFADSATQLLLTHDADGLDVDWEYPGHGEAGIQSSPRDRPNFTLLLKTLRMTLDRAGVEHGQRLTLSMAAADGPFVDGVDIAAIEPSLDWFNLMTYDFNNSLTPTTGHHTGLHASALAPADARDTEKAVRQFLAAGVPPRKLLIGAAFYGREFADVKAQHHGLYQTYGHYQGEHPWPELESRFINRRGYVRYWDADAQAPYLWNADTRHFISYDDPHSLAAKAVWVKAHHLGGIMYWEQGQDPQGELLDALWRGLQ